MTKARFDSPRVQMSSIAVGDEATAARAGENVAFEIGDDAEAEAELDDAIAECQSNIDRNRQNAHLRKQLLAMYSEKQQTLEDVLREDTNVVTNR